MKEEMEMILDMFENVKGCIRSIEVDALIILFSFLYIVEFLLKICYSWASTVFRSLERNGHNIE